MIEPVIELSWMGITLVPIVVALTSLIKSTFPVVEGRWAPGVALLIACVLSYLVEGVVFMESQLLGGLVVGLMASGGYSAAKAAFFTSKQ